MILPSVLHLVICFVIALMAGLYFRSPMKGYLIALSIGFIKEVVDYVCNRWGMTQIDLLRDCVWDLDFDIIGAYVGGLLVWFLECRKK